MIRTYFVVGGLSLSLLLTGFPLGAQPGNKAVSDTQTASAAQSVDPVQTALRQAIASYMRESEVTPDANQRFLSEFIDLNDDGVLDALVVLSSTDWCGTGGCTMLVFEGYDKGFRLVSSSTLIQTPLTVSETRSNGWRDLVVDVGGGGATSAKAALKFNGKDYPSNPSTQPSLPSNATIKGVALFPDGSKPQQMVVTAAQTSNQVTRLSQSVDSLERGWKLTGWGDPSNLTPVVAGSEVTANFEEERVSGSAGCNNYTASYKTNGQELKLGAIAATRRACATPISDQEFQYLSALEKAQTYEVTSRGELQVTYQAETGNKILVFVPQTVRALW